MNQITLLLVNSSVCIRKHLFIYITSDLLVPFFLLLTNDQLHELLQ